MITSKIKSFDDERGSLLPIEFSNLPFTPKRIFIVNNVPVGTTRGSHSHYTTKQLIICINGSVDVILHDGLKKTKHRLHKNQQILVPELIWDSQIFLVENTEIMVICSTNFELSDYIFDFETFLKIKNKEV